MNPLWKRGVPGGSADHLTMCGWTLLQRAHAGCRSPCSLSSQPTKTRGVRARPTPALPSGRVSVAMRSSPARSNRRLRRESVCAASSVAAGVTHVAAGRPRRALGSPSCCYPQRPSSTFALVAGRGLRVQPRRRALREPGERALAPLQTEGWRLRHSLPGRAGGTSTAGDCAHGRRVRN